MHACWIPLGVSVLFVAFSWTPSLAGNCGKPGCQGCAAAAPCGQCAEEVQYEAHQVTEYKTVYEEVKVPKVVDTVKFVAETELREAPCSVCEQACPTCGPADCENCEACQAAPCKKVCGMRKVPVTVYRAVPDKKTIETVQIVERKIPHTYTCYVPKPAPCACEPCK